MADSATLEAVKIDKDAGDFSYPEEYKYDAGYGLSEDTLDFISNAKGEADWIREFRKKALKIFNDKPMPTHWASKDLENIIFQKIRYYLAKGQKPTRNWDEVPDDVKETFERLGIPEKERKYLAGVSIPRFSGSGLAKLFQRVTTSSQRSTVLSFLAAASSTCLLE